VKIESALSKSERQRNELEGNESRLRKELGELRRSAEQAHADQLASNLAAREHQLTRAYRENALLKAELTARERANSTLEKEVADLAAECRAMEHFITQSLDACDTCNQAGCDGNPDLGGQRVLCVGGLNRLVGQYRELVARCNGRFEHYDGGIEDSRQRLDALLSSADAVVCATDAVSHDAYYRLKRFCKRSDKPHVFLRNSGLSSFARALYNMTGGPAPA